MKTLRGVDFTKYVLSVIIQTLIVRITKRHNSCYSDPSVPIFLANVHCLMGEVWCNFEQNQTKAISYRAKTNFTSMINLIKRITKRHNSCYTDPSAPIFSLNMTCILWWSRCGVNLNKIDQKLSKLYSKTLKFWWKDGITDMLKTVYTPKTPFCGGYKYFFQHQTSSCTSSICM